MDRYTNVHKKTIDRYTHRKIEINIHACMHTIMNIILVNCNVLEITEKYLGSGVTPHFQTQESMSQCVLSKMACLYCAN